LVYVVEDSFIGSPSVVSPKKGLKCHKTDCTTILENLLR